MCTTCVNDTGSKFAPSVNFTAANLPPVSTSPVANLPPVLTAPVVNFATGTAGVDTGVNNTGGKLPLTSMTPATGVVWKIIVTIAECFQLY